MRLTWDCDRSTWQAVLEGSGQATFFHAPAWADLFAAAGPGRRIEVLHARWPDGREAVLPVGVRRLWRGLVTEGLAGTEFGYGGIIATGPLTDEEQQRLVRAWRYRFPDCGGRSNPLQAPPATMADLAVRDDFPTRLLAVAPLVTLRQGYNRERLRAVKRYQAQGVTVRVVGDPDPADRQVFRRLYELEVASWQHRGFDTRWVRSEAWFDRFWLLTRGRVRVAFATVQGQPVGAEVVVHQGRQATGLFLAWDRRFDDCRISTALTEACLQDCLDRGMTHWDFMPSGHNASLDRFKASFGAEARAICRFEHVTLTRRALLAVSRLRRLPGAGGSLPTSLKDAPEAIAPSAETLTA